MKTTRHLYSLDQLIDGVGIDAATQSHVHYILHRINRLPGQQLLYMLDKYNEQRLTSLWEMGVLAYERSEVVRRGKYTYHYYFTLRGLGIEDL